MSRFKETTPEAFVTLLNKRAMSTSPNDRMVILAYAGLEALDGGWNGLETARKVAKLMQSGTTLEEAIKAITTEEASE